MNDELKSQLSAYVDGELHPEESELLIRRLCRDESMQQTVASYAFIGEALRGGELVSPPADFADRIMMTVEGHATAPPAAPPVRPASRAPRWGVGVAAAVALAVVALMTLPERVAETPTSVAATNTDAAPPAALADSASPAILADSGPPLIPAAAGITAGSFDVPMRIPVERRSAENRARLNNYLLQHLSTAGATRQGLVTYRNVGFVAETDSER